MTLIFVFMLASTATFLSLLVIYYFKIGVYVRNAKTGVIILAIAFSLLLNSLLFILLGYYEFLGDLSTCLLFCNAVCDFMWKYTWIAIVLIISLLLSAVFWIIQSRLILEIVLSKILLNNINFT